MRVTLRVEEHELQGLRTWDQFAEKLIRLADAGFDEIEIDLGPVRQVSSLALGTIAATHQKMATAGRRLVLTNLSEDVRRLVAATQLAGLLAIE